MAPSKTAATTFFTVKPSKRLDLRNGVDLARSGIRRRVVRQLDPLSELRPAQKATQQSRGPKIAGPKELESDMQLTATVKEEIQLRVWQSTAQAARRKVLALGADHFAGLFPSFDNTL